MKLGGEIRRQSRPPLLRRPGGAISQETAAIRPSASGHRCAQAHRRSHRGRQLRPNQKGLSTDPAHSSTSPAQTNAWPSAPPDLADSDGAQKVTGWAGPPTATTRSAQAGDRAEAQKSVSGPKDVQHSHRPRKSRPAPCSPGSAAVFCRPQGPGALKHGPKPAGAGADATVSLPFRPVTLGQPCGFSGARHTCWPQPPPPVWPWVRRPHGLKRVGHGGTPGTAVTGCYRSPWVRQPAAALPCRVAKAYSRQPSSLGLRTSSDDSLVRLLERAAVPDLKPPAP